jgi:hypothetical protein
MGDGACIGKLQSAAAGDASMRMNDSEKSVYEYLTSQGLGTVVFQPDGQRPLDFLVDGRIAVEARRLNQNEETATGYRGLEELSEPLNERVEKALAAMGPPVDGVSWWVRYTYRRPLPPRRKLDALLRRALREVRDQPDLRDQELRVTNNMRLRFIRAGAMHPNRFVLGASSDRDSGGFVVSEMARNLRICIAEKDVKVSKVRHRYSEWWLAFEDRIGYGLLDEQDRRQLRALVRFDDRWSKIILVNPLKPSTGFEL